MIMEMPRRFRSPSQLGRIPRSAAFVATMALLLLAPLAHTPPRGLSAVGGVPLPAAAGTEWQIIAGYNTATHAGQDAEAIDIVRVDGPTAGSRALAPVGGTLGCVGSDCLSLHGGGGRSHLLCHVLSLNGLERGMEVAAGQWLATVAPDGQAPACQQTRS